MKNVMGIFGAIVFFIAVVGFIGLVASAKVYFCKQKYPTASTVGCLLGN